MKENPDKVIKADQCAQYVDDIGIAAKDGDHHIPELRATLNASNLKLTMHKGHFCATENDFLGGTIIPQGVKHQQQNLQNFS